MKDSSRKEAVCRNIFDAIRVNSLPAVQACLVFGGSVDLRDSHGWTPLHHAAWYDCPEIFSYLLSQGADQSAFTRSGEMPLQIAIRNKSSAVLEFLNEMTMVA